MATVWNDPDSIGSAIMAHQIVNPVRANPKNQEATAPNQTNKWRNPDEIGAARSIDQLPPVAVEEPPTPLTVRVKGQTPMITEDEEAQRLKLQIKQLGLEGTDHARQTMRQIAQTEYNRPGGPRPVVRGSLARWGIGAPGA